MKITLISFLLATLASIAYANFHVTELHDVSYDGEGGETDSYFWLACPSDYYNCDCFLNYDRSGEVAGGSPGNSYFEIKSGLCGLSQLNFYKQSDGTYEFYINNGNGEVQGTCYDNGDPGGECPVQYPTGEGSDTRTIVHDWVCYSYVCGS